MTTTLEKRCQIDAEARIAHGWCDDTCERWSPVPGFESAYQISSYGRVRSLDRTVIRCNGWHYRVQGRMRRISVDKRDGLRSVALATGRRGHYHTIYPDRLVEQLFGEQAAA